MAGKQLRSRVVELHSDMSEHSDIDLPCGQVESFEETTDDALVGEVQLSEHNDNIVNAVVATDDRPGVPPSTVCSKIQATDSHDSLREFIANMFGSLNEKIEDNNTKLSEKMENNNTKLSKELSERIEDNNTKLSEKIEENNTKLSKDLSEKIEKENLKLKKELKENIWK
jgi:hypothetical protein